ncbi:Fibrous sheath-interacting protein 2 [Folsomia candida]|uniref:Fibrous sheath-interacting protein 2 n=1 Tax=Folsomia candida TaxID=158441 RepID=A0A226EXT4_FOLCA|nr:Fibrous sheath-interacting protein 2 [Folsomia candida]
MESVNVTTRKSNCRQNTVSNTRPQLYDLSKVPRSEILSIKTKTAVDILRQRFPVSSRGKPPSGLHRWCRLPQTTDVPRYSRGRMGSSLIPREIPSFTLYNDRVLKSCYNPLHDPDCLNYFTLPQVRDMLESRGLITKAGNVLCSLAEMQQFHEYLMDISNSRINQFFMNQNCRDLYEFEQRKILTSPRKKQGTATKHIENKSSAPSAKMVAELRELALLKNRELKQVQLLEKGLERDMHLQLVILKCRDQEMERRRQLLLQQTIKDIAACVRKENNAIALNEKKQRRVIIQLYLISSVGPRRTVLYLWTIVKKYFYIWLNKTRERKAGRKNLDTRHQSAFIGQQGQPDPAAKAVMELEQELKKDGVANFFMNIMRIRGAFKLRPDDSVTSTSISMVSVEGSNASLIKPFSSGWKNAVKNKADKNNLDDSLSSQADVRNH